jgi:ATP-dependent DNA helicase RecQ
LGKNQVRSLVDELEVDARLFTNTESAPEQQKKMAQDLVDEDGSIQVLVTTPETLSKNKMLRDALSIASDMNKIFCVAIDEAHVAEPWGRDFRPAYVYLAESLQILDRSKIPLYACTASADREAQLRILETLSMSMNAATFVASADRPEIQLAVVYKELLDADDRDSVVSKMAAYIKEDTCGLIYCRNKSTVDRVTSMLQSVEGFDELVLPYHAGLDQHVRRRNQEAWEEGDVSVLVCTIAFGMGINKRNVRYVLHYDPPQDLAEYYQQIGRAGRDGQLAYAVLFASHEEIEQGKRRDRHGGMHGIEEYVYSGSCRRKILSGHFGEGTSCSRLSREFHCDVCQKSARLDEAIHKIERLATERAEGAVNHIKRPAGDPSPCKPIRPSVLQKMDSNSPSKPDAFIQKPSISSAVTAAFVSPWRRGGGPVAPERSTG